MSTLSIVIIIMGLIMGFFYGAGTIIECLIDFIDYMMEEEDEDDPIHD